jgi:N-acetylglutamate synthase-like GNAT family acetyltransferase
MGYLWCIGVLEKFRGQGKSRELVTSTLEAMKLDGITECWLKTEDPKNVLVYTKLGFEMVRHIQVKNSNLPTWFFKKPIQ